MEKCIKDKTKSSYNLLTENGANCHHQIQDADFSYYNLKPLWVWANDQTIPGCQLQIFITRIDRSMFLIDQHWKALCIVSSLWCCQQEPEKAIIQFLGDNRDDLDKETLGKLPSIQQIPK